MKRKTIDWNEFQQAAARGESVEVTTGEILDLLDSRNRALESLQDIIDECPRPTRPYGKRVVDIAKSRLRAEGYQRWKERRKEK